MQWPTIFTVIVHILKFRVRRNTLEWHRDMTNSMGQYIVGHHVCQFKAHANLHNLKVQGEAGSADEEAAKSLHLLHFFK